MQDMRYYVKITVHRRVCVIHNAVTEWGKLLQFYLKNSNGGGGGRVLLGCNCVSRLKETKI